MASRRAEIWQLLRAAEAPMGVADLAEQLQVHPNTVRFHVETLLAQGKIERVAPPHRAPGRPPLLFQAVRRMDPEGPRRYQLLAEILADALADAPDARRRAVAAGRSWWRQQAHRLAPVDEAAPAPTDRLVGVLDELGFAPEVATSGSDGARIELRHCPFLDLTSEPSRARADVICPVHLGLMQGALEDWDAAIAVTGLDPMVEPDLCVAHLATLTA